MTGLTFPQRKALGVLTQAAHEGRAVAAGIHTSRVGSLYPRVHWQTADALVDHGYAVRSGSYITLTAEGERMARLLAEES